MGMGLPIFCILFGFLVGWYVVRYLYKDEQEPVMMMKRIWKYAVITSGFTFLFMVMIWGRMVIMLVDPNTDFYNFGIPFILYDPKASFLGWLILMIFISPFLQLMTTVVAAFLALQRKLSEQLRVK